jgi:membrane fusion protein (multidrug efflux system)
MKRRITAMLAGVAAIGGGLYGFHLYDARYPATDNAYVTADVVHVAPQIDGRVQQVAVRNQQHVAGGALLYRIDPKPFQLAVARARAHLQQARQQVAHDAAAVVSAQAEVKRLQVLLRNATSRARRSAALKSDNYVSQQTAEDAQAERLATKAALNVAQARLDEARQQLGQPGDDNQAVREAKAALEQAQWRLDNTRIAASCAGRITELTLQPGDAVKTGQANFVVICDGRFWVDANFKETELARIRPGQPVDIVLDMYPGIDFHGQVESINGASGVAFSLLPPQNATGNWVKITQRVPVRIRVDSSDASHPLLVGTSAQVRVDTTIGS